MTKITIAIVTHIPGPKLDATIQSILRQTLKNVEVLCITDISANFHNTASLKYFNSGIGFQILMVDDVRCLTQTVRAVLSVAKGTHLIFIREGDLFSHENSCLQIVRILSRSKVDILHFVKDESTSRYSDSYQSRILPHAPYIKKLTKKDIMVECFEKRRFGCSMYDKAFTLALMHKAFGNSIDLCGVEGDEAAVFFLLASTADGYMGTKDVYIVHDTDLLNERSNTALAYKTNACGNEIVRMLELSLKKNGTLDICRSAFESFRAWQLQSILEEWFHETNCKESAQIFQMIWKAWGAMAVLSELAHTHWQQPDKVADRIKHIPIWNPKPKKIKTIGTFYYRIGNGGLERVLTTLIALWTAEGYRVVLFTDDRSDGEEYALPKDIERVVLPDTFTMNKSTISSRMQAWQSAMPAYEIDIVIAHAWISPILLWDILSVKAMNIPYVQYTHGAFSCMLMESDNEAKHYFTQLTHVYSLCDCVVTLSHVNQAFWQCFNDRVYMIYNPSHLDMEKIQPSNLNKPDIVWVGRISPEKHPMDAVRIMRHVVDAIPEATLHIVGKAEKNLAYLEKEIRNEISKLNLDRNIMLEGFHQKTDVYYQNASVYLSTSAYEGFPMALMESKIFGLPCVMYDLPYLEVAKDPTGLCMVPQASIKEAAESIIHLLKHTDDRKRLGRDARESAKNFSNTLVINAWTSLLHDMENPSAPKKQKSDIDIMLQTIIEHLSLGTQGDVRQNNNLGGMSFIVLIRKAKTIQRCYRQEGLKGIWLLLMKKLSS